ncbi:MAG: carboxypeptidase-like regulatory domain-containing protein, partial [Bacteroidetes bacterium]|nr:carboxypeptidase-like regulatory domain-containing protein [Bacteroidota bacterium]
NPLPYPLLDVQLGNQSFIYNSNTFNLMRFVEFVADESYSGFYEHNFEGGFLNRIKGVRNWKLRTFAHVRGVWGKISDTNWSLIPDYNLYGESVTKFQKFGKVPYMEIGYGIENIFKLLRVDFIHRLTYLSNPNIRPFGVFISVQFKL